MKSEVNFTIDRVQGRKISKNAGIFKGNSLIVFLFIALLFSPILSFCQEPKKPVLDGTEGDVFEDAETSDTKGKYAKWNYFDGPLTTLKIGGGFLYEVAAYSQDAESKEQFDLSTAFKVRDARLTLSGKFKFKREFTWKVGMMYDLATDEWLIRETGIIIGVPELRGRFFIGRTKEGFSLNKVMNGYSGWMMERQMALDIIPILADGVRWMGYLPKQHLFWDAGAYVNWLSKDQSFSTYDWQVALRAGWVPLNSDKTVLHLAFNGRYGDVENGELQVRSRPEATPAPYFLDAGKLAADYTTHFGGEAYYRSGPLMMGSEIYIHNIHSPASDYPVFPGGEVFVSYIFTGETRPYYTASNIFGFIDTKKSVFNGGKGTWEGIVRFSTLDLNDGLVNGGSFWRITPQVNWYLSNNVRLEFVYGYGVLNRFELMGGTHFFQSRIQFML